MKTITSTRRNGLRPAGETASYVRHFGGEAQDGICSDRSIGRADVDSGRGDWRLRQRVTDMPMTVCVESAVGGSTTVALGA